MITLCVLCHLCAVTNSWLVYSTDGRTVGHFNRSGGGGWGSHNDGALHLYCNILC